MNSFPPIGPCFGGCANAIMTDLKQESSATDADLILILLGWKVAGWIGVDRWLLPALGTPWQPGGGPRRVAGATPGS